MRTELHVPSDLKFLAVIEHWLLESLKAEVGDHVEWSSLENRLRLVLVEAYSNVVRHAHKDRPNLPVLIRLEVDDYHLSLEVWDYGKGFDLSTYLAPSPGDYQEGGYGWLILNRLMDKVEYQLRVRGGLNCLRMQTKLSIIS
ncbi:MAG: ATP-binding protein [Pseudanabaenales cyanobacterium]|nr:ATP-binding protein [Pseudanabaenales cyanobacterium]